MTGGYLEAGAAFSPCGRYRCALFRRWSEAGGRCLFILLNPSTADAVRDDPTVRRCMGYARAWGYGEAEVVNLFALRATRPADLKAHPEPEGAGNLAAILRAARRVGRGGPIVCAWGAHGAHRGQDEKVTALLLKHGFTLLCLRRTRDGHPAHVLRLPGGLRPVPFGPR